MIDRNCSDDKKSLNFSEKYKEHSNNFFMGQLEAATKDNLKVLTDLRTKVKYTFWSTLILYILLFALGFALLSVPIVAAYRGDISLYNSILGGALGITDIVAVMMLKPVERIHDLMGDMSQIAMAINSYQQQVALRILQFDSDDRTTINLAAEKIGEITETNMFLIQKYVEGAK
jgi:hypothetical protein